VLQTAALLFALHLDTPDGAQLRAKAAAQARQAVGRARTAAKLSAKAAASGSDSKLLPPDPPSVPADIAELLARQSTALSHFDLLLAAARQLGSADDVAHFSAMLARELACCAAEVEACVYSPAKHRLQAATIDAKALPQSGDAAAAQQLSLLAAEIGAAAFIVKAAEDVIGRLEQRLEMLLHTVDHSVRSAVLRIVSESPLGALGKAPNG
jgi:hypothetical protein